MCFAFGSEFETFLHSANIIPILAIVVGCGTGVIAIVCCSIAGVAKSKAHEATKREIAAYVAEGTIAPDMAIAMLNAGEVSVEIGEDIKIR